MKITPTKLSALVTLPVLLTGSLWLSTACRTVTGSEVLDSATPSAQSGSELWAQNCRRCHNFRSPSEFGDSEWDVAMFHMRVRANLTAEEYTAIRQHIENSN